MFLTVCSLLLFLLAVFALIGMSSFSGALQYQCVGESGDPSSMSDTPSTSSVCTDAQLHEARLMGLTCSGDCDLPLYLANGARLSMDSGEGIMCPTECPHTLLCAEDHKWCAPLRAQFCCKLLFLCCRRKESVSFLQKLPENLCASELHPSKTPKTRTQSWRHSS